MSAAFSPLPVRRLQRHPEADVDLLSWPATLPAVHQVLSAGLDLGPATVLVGENGTGKSTLAEALAIAFGMSPEGGTRFARHSTRPTESDLHQSLQLVRGAGASRWGFFLRAETMHGLYTYLENNPNPDSQDPAYHEMSHGESFLEVLATRFDTPGLYLLDEPESALSFTGCLALVDRLNQLLTHAQSQVVVATHSPIVAALPGATILEAGPWGLRPANWADLELVGHWRRFLADPQSYLRHVIED